MKLSLILISFLVSFYSGLNTESLDEIIQRAKKANVPYMINLHAEWCTSCKFMEETCMQDPRVTSLLSEKYEFAKLDLESLDGQLLAVQHDIQTLPATLIFNSQGNLVFKKQSSMSAAELSEVLRKHQTPHVKLKSNNYGLEDAFTINNSTNGRAIQNSEKKKEWWKVFEK